MADKDNKKLEQNQKEKPMSFMMMTVLTGLIGGIFWSGVGYITHVLNFTEIPANTILEPWTIGEWKDGWLGIMISILLMGAISIVAALIYYVVLRRFYSIWVGVGYGIVLFLLVFFVLNPIFPGIPPFGELERNTIITSACLYILYGVFVGYSISYENSEIKKQEQKAEAAEVRS